MRKSLLKIIICFMSVMLLAGCENDSDASDSAPEDKPENVSEPVKEEETTSLAQRMAGKYSYKYSDEELYIMDVIPFGDNLYAFCGQAMTEDSDSTEAYTFWASEFIPYDADKITGDTVTVNELRFSVMSNAGKYWDRGCKGTVTLTDDGLVFEGFENDGFLTADNGDSRLFVKDDRVENAFSYLKDDKKEGPEELQGLWVYGDDDIDQYIKISGSNMYIYRKDPGQEVFYAAGSCDFHDGSFEFSGNLIENGGMPFELTGEYKTDGGGLTLKVQGYDVPDWLLGSEDFRQVSEQQVHVTTMDEVE